MEVFQKPVVKFVPAIMIPYFSMIFHPVLCLDILLNENSLVGLVSLMTEVM